LGSARLHGYFGVLPRLILDVRVHWRELVACAMGSEAYSIEGPSMLYGLLPIDHANELSVLGWIGTARDNYEQ